MIEPTMWAQFGEMHYQDLLQEARLDRLCREAKAAGPGFRDRLLLSVGEFLVSIGQSLRELSLAAGRDADLPSLRTG